MSDLVPRVNFIRVSCWEKSSEEECVSFAVEAKVAQLVAAVPTCRNIITATKLVECTRRFIDDELDFHDKIGKRELFIDNDEYDSDNDEYDWKEFDPFLRRFCSVVACEWSAAETSSFK